MDISINKSIQVQTQDLPGCQFPNLGQKPTTWQDFWKKTSMKTRQHSSRMHTAYFPSSSRGGVIVYPTPPMQTPDPDPTGCRPLPQMQTPCRQTCCWQTPWMQIAPWMLAMRPVKDTAKPNPSPVNRMIHRCSTKVFPQLNFICRR